MQEKCIIFYYLVIYMNVAKARVLDFFCIEVLVIYSLRDIQNEVLITSRLKKMRTCSVTQVVGNLFLITKAIPFCSNAKMITH